MEISNYDIDIYCQSAKIAPQYRKASVQESINQMASRISVTLSGLTYDQLVDVTVSSVYDGIKQMNWSTNDIEGITWFLGKYIRAMLKANLISDFDKMFKSAIRSYYNTYC